MSTTQAGPTRSDAAPGTAIPPIPRPDLLAPGQALRAVAAGLAFWFAGVLLIRHGGAAGWFGGLGSLAMFAVAVLAGAPTVWSLRWAAGLGPAQVVPGVSLATAAAIVCDGIAFTWWPRLYGNHASHLAGAAWILFAGGVGLLFAWLDSHRGTTRPTPSAP